MRGHNCSARGEPTRRVVPVRPSDGCDLFPLPLLDAVFFSRVQKAIGVAVLLVALYLAASLIRCFQLQMRMGLQDASNRDDEVAARRRRRDNGTT